MFDEPGILLAAIGAIAFFAGFLHSAIGFGFGIVAISLLPFVIDAKSAHIVVSISSVPMLMMAAWTYREGIEKRSLALALLGAAIFLPLGLWLFESVSLDLLVRGTGLGILVMVILSLRRVSSAQHAGSVGRSSFIAGAVSGFLAGAVSIAGPPIAAFALKQGWSQARYKAFVTQCLLVMSIYKAALLVFRSHVEGPVAAQIAVAAALAIAGVQAGAIASRGISAVQFKRVVAVALIAVACLMMWQGQSKTRDSSSEKTGKQFAFQASPSRGPAEACSLIRQGDSASHTSASKSLWMPLNMDAIEEAQAMDRHSVRDRAAEEFDTDGIVNSVTEPLVAVVPEPF